MKRKIYIRVDGSAEIGLGHLIRCVALSEMLCPHFSVTFICKETPGFFGREIANKASVVMIKKEEDIFDHLAEDSIVVIDGYQFEPTYYEKLKKHNYTTVSIQDVHHFTRNIDLVINHLPETQNYYGEIDCLCGPKYAVIREEFLNQRPAITDQKKYFISLGGTKNFSVINKIVDLINQIDPEVRIEILTTDENKKWIVGKNFYVHTNKGAKEVVYLIDQSSVCFITSGMVAYEVLSRRKKAIVGALNKGQHTVGQEFGHLGFIEYLGEWEKINKSRLTAALEFKSIDEQKIHQIFDGKSGERILEKFRKL